MTDVRLLSYNVRSLRDDQDALVRVVRGCAADVVCVQEMPRFLRWRAKGRRFARDCGLVVAAGRRAAGLAVLAGPRVRVTHTEYHLLSPVPGMHRRGLALAVVEAERRRLIVASTHLDLADEPRRRHVTEILGLLDRTRAEHEAPAVLAGDVNEQPDGRSWRALADGLQDAHVVRPSGGEHTYSSAEPRRRIDGVFADRGIEVLGCGVPADAASPADLAKATDHLPVVADLRLP